MTEDQQNWERVKDIVASALELPRNRRETFVAVQCGDDSTLLSLVNEMLATDDDTDEIINNDIDILVGVTPLPDVSGLTDFDGFHIQRLLARGGTSDVYLALQKHPERSVAIKIFRAGLSSTRQLGRFQGEVEILARLEHPYIAAIYAAGMSDKVAPVPLPYLAMEYVEGELLTEFVRSNALTLKAKLELMTLVCEGVHGAHQRGVIHRDLKPANILVKPDGTPKILDFGIARAIDSGNTNSKRHTMTGELLGTLAYMSPEQLGEDSATIDIRTDVYSLGVLLYEILANQAAYDVGSVSIPEAMKMIERGDARAIRSLGVDCEADVEAVVSKAMAVDRDQRYNSVASFAKDLRQLLAGEPVEAHPPTTMYRLRKFTRRNKAMVASGVIVTALILLLSALSVFGFILASAERDAAIQAKESATVALHRGDSINEYIRTMLTSPDPAIHGADIMVVDVLNTWAANVNEAFPNDPDIRAELHSMLGDTYYALGKYPESLNHFHQSLELVQVLPNPNINLEVSLDASIANSLLYMDRLEEAGTIIAEAVPHAMTDLGPTDPTTLFLRGVQGEHARLIGDYDKAEAIFIDAVSDALAEYGDQHQQYLSALDGLARVYLSREEPVKAAKVLEELVETRKLLLPPGHVTTLLNESNLATALAESGDFERAAEIYFRIIKDGESQFGPLHHTVRMSRSNIVDVLYRLDRPDEALAMSDRVLEDTREINGEMHTDTLIAYSNRAVLLLNLRRHEEAIVFTTLVYERTLDTLGEAHPRTLIAIRNHAGALQGVGRLDEAESMLILLRAGYLESPGPKSIPYLGTANNLAMVMHDQGKYTQAIEMLTETIAFADDSEECPTIYVGLFERNLGRCFMGAELYQESETHFQRSLRLLAEAPQHMQDRTQEFLDEMNSKREP